MDHSTLKDAVMYGTGVSKNGKHIPLRDIYPKPDRSELIAFYLRTLIFLALAATVVSYVIMYFLGCLK